MALRGVLVRDVARHQDADWLRITSDPADVLDDPHVKKAYLGEEDEVLDALDDTIPVAEASA